MTQQLKELAYFIRPGDPLGLEICHWIFSLLSLKLDEERELDDITTFAEFG